MIDVLVWGWLRHYEKLGHTSTVAGVLLMVAGASLSIAGALPVLIYGKSTFIFWSWLAGFVLSIPVMISAGGLICCSVGKIKACKSS